ncbi:hypothetical protein RM572_00555 [Streptomyces sp. DSM 42041]|uniref:DUF732 domain-containing protein n=1 Tax=Streptomyces hazeniae TaxID=3075538 RepID=A0ABU2NJU2_9ACTN|nr:hypothetical protein [Streptomyces sp. DSM 42041]MDT0377266.1 hypothetical protein [Streptomyces sp. DSM 42041]
MDETPPRRTRTALRAAILIAGALLVAAAFYAGRTTAPEPASDPGAAACDDAHATLEDLEAQLTDGDSATYDEEQANRQLALTAATVVVQNPDCFDAAARADARRALDAAREEADDQDAARLREDLLACASAETEAQRALFC